ncbi:MAG: hypothetical protein LC635_05475 [Pseudonocardiaceae bacterium]|nr:hypothetical protein [Pseudonocardiaceae bacterium]
MDNVRRDVADVRSLASGTHEEVGHLRTAVRANTEAIESLGQEVRDGFAKVDERFTKVDERFTNVDERFVKLETEMRDGFTKIDERFTRVDDRLRAHDRSLEALRETQIEHRQEMLAGFAKLDAKMDHGFTMLSIGQAQITAWLSVAMRNNKEGEGEDPR